MDKRQQMDLPRGAGFDAVNPDVIIEDEMAHERPLQAGENPVKWHQAVRRTIDRAIRRTIRR